MSKFWLRKTRRVLIDVDTQFDILAELPDWKKGHRVRNIRRVMAWARQQQISVVSTALCYRPGDINGDGRPKTICREGTDGARKIPYTLMPSLLRFEPSQSTDLPVDLLATYQQVIFEKRTPDTFTQPRADRLLSNLKADEFIVMGTHVESALCSTVLGLIARHKSVSIVNDAIFSSDKKACQLALRKMEAKGAKLITTESLTGKRAVHQRTSRLSAS